MFIIEFPTIAISREEQLAGDARNKYLFFIDWFNDIS